MGEKCLKSGHQCGERTEKQREVPDSESEEVVRGRDSSREDGPIWWHVEGGGAGVMSLSGQPGGQLDDECLPQTPGGQQKGVGTAAEGTAIPVRAERPAVRQGSAPSHGNCRQRDNDDARETNLGGCALRG